jgi:hypothetical protein
MQSFDTAHCCVPQAGVQTEAEAEALARLGTCFCFCIMKQACLIFGGRARTESLLWSITSEFIFLVDFRLSRKYTSSPTKVIFTMPKKVRNDTLDQLIAKSGSFNISVK